MRNLLAILLMLASTAAAGAQTIDRVKILEFGVFERDVIEIVPTEGVATGRLQIAKNFRLKEKSDVIVARLGTSFGVRFQTVGVPMGKAVKLTWITRFPAEGLKDPKNGVFYRNEFTRSHTIGEDSHRTYSFDEPWEMVPGEWAFEFWDGPKKLGEKRFKVILPPIS